MSIVNVEFESMAFGLMVASSGIYLNVGRKLLGIEWSDPEDV